MYPPGYVRASFLGVLFSKKLFMGTIFVFNTVGRIPILSITCYSLPLGSDPVFLAHLICEFGPASELDKSAGC